MADKPLCGGLPAVDTRLEKVLWFFGIIGGVISGISAAYSVADKFHAVTGFLGVSTTVGIAGAAIGAYTVTVGLFVYWWYDKCHADPEGRRLCLSGVVDKVRGEDFSGFDFAADFPHIDVVLKSKYWNILNVSNAEMIHCSDAAGPVLKAVFYSHRVCKAAAGAVAGAAFGGAVGVGLGVAAGTAVAAGCATVFLCLLGILIAIIIVVVAAVTGAIGGSAIGSATADETVPEAAGGVAISVADLISLQGPVRISGEFEGAVVQHFTERSALLGTTGQKSPFSHEVADQEIPDNMEACPL